MVILGNVKFECEGVYNRYFICFNIIILFDNKIWRMVDKYNKFYWLIPHAARTGLNFQHLLFQG